ncbi:uncharacterized protein LOC132624389 [Lycium barbarum]|uniref:uncharacterized protein LOC132624389 n=1 Tax=Lycium barbarum TaxID=112863 RepID=UPI00293F3F6F|nr:uncharacterized protein LOC132624389 [Lycium barbarum]
MSPNKTLAQMPESGRKKDKFRITVMLTCNALGTEKIKPLTIGSVAKPHCYKHVDMDSFPHINYFFNKKAWMTRDIFKQYMLGLNAKFEDENRKILLLMDNATPHDIEEYEDRLTHIKVHYLSRNMASHLQQVNADVNPNVNSENLELVEDVISVSSLIAQIPSHNTNQAMDATTYMEFYATLPILETYIDEEIIAQVIRMEEQETSDTEGDNESVDEEPQPAATWDEIEESVVKL